MYGEKQTITENFSISMVSAKINGGLSDNRIYPKAYQQEYPIKSR